MVDEPVEEHASSVRDRAVGALVGLAVGDAVGTTLEFKPRDSYEHITDMVGGGPFRPRTRTVDGRHQYGAVPRRHTP